ncbi:MAG: hypothetical protein EOP17_00320 [Rhizobiaceae bacterium]|nr:MAG: hypothetical protein EOP17_00320 [Rhizobiaceae bacterium]
MHFRHFAPADLTVHRRFFRTPVQFDSDFDGIACRSASFQLSIRQAAASERAIRASRAFMNQRGYERIWHPTCKSPLSAIQTVSAKFPP